LKHDYYIMAGAGDTPKQPLEEVPESRSTGTGNFMNTSNDYSDKSLLKGLLAVCLNAITTIRLSLCMFNAYLAMRHVHI